MVPDSVWMVGNPETGPVGAENGLLPDNSAGICQPSNSRDPGTTRTLARCIWLREARASERNTPQAASRSTRTRQPSAVAMFTSASNEKREARLLSAPPNI
jgi:hypothetical protein